MLRSAQGVAPPLKLIDAPLGGAPPLLRTTALKDLSWDIWSKISQMIGI